MAAIAQLKAMLHMDTRQFKAGMRRVDLTTKRTTTSLQRHLGRVQPLFAKSFSVAAIVTGLAAAAKAAENFGKKAAQAATISKMSTDEIRKGIKGISGEIGINKDNLAEGLYDALSAGVTDADAFDFLKVAAQAGVAGAGSTADAVDILTTALNAFGKPASEAAAVADTLFATVRLGKTTLSELAESFAQVAPAANASGVELEQVLAAAATLTKSGTKTAQAMTQIRAAILAMNDKLGDGWAKTMTLQEGMVAMRDAARGSVSALREMTGRVEGTLGILGLTGDKAKEAAKDLFSVTNAAGDMGKAFEIMDQENSIGKMTEKLKNLVDTLGDFVLGAGKAMKAYLDLAAAGMEETATDMIGTEGVSDGKTLGDMRKEALAKKKHQEWMASQESAAAGDVSGVGDVDEATRKKYAKMAEEERQAGLTPEQRLAEVTAAQSANESQIGQGNSAQQLYEIEIRRLELAKQRKQIEDEIYKRDVDLLEKEMRYKEERQAIQDRAVEQVEGARASFEEQMRTGMAGRGMDATISSTGAFSGTERGNLGVEDRQMQIAKEGLTVQQQIREIMSRFESDMKGLRAAMENNR